MEHPQLLTQTSNKTESRLPVDISNNMADTSQKNSKDVKVSQDELKDIQGTVEEGDISNGHLSRSLSQRHLVSNLLASSTLQLTITPSQRC